MYYTWNKDLNTRYCMTDYSDAIDYARFCAFHGYEVEIIDENGNEVEL